MYLAYRKVKVELWWGKCVPSLQALATFEKTPETLEKNLGSLRKKIKSFTINSDFDEAFGPNFLGTCYSLPKSLTKKKPEKEGVHFTPLTNDKDYDPIPRDYDVEIRYMAQPSIEFQVLGVLWAMDEGASLDASRSDSSRANALNRRFNDDNVSDGGSTDIENERKNTGKGPINKEFTGLYRPYFRAYKAWRNDGLECAKTAV